MNDRFRFRVWDKEKNEYIYQMDWSYWDLCFWYEPYKQDIEPVLMDIDGKHIPEQCTGLKDKNGGFIYENDLLKDKNGIWQVKWDDKEAAFYIWNKEKDFYLSPFIGEYEIIGNIHENPELLKEKE